MPIIDMENVEKVYQTGKYKFRALKGIDLQVEPGEMVAIMGPSGCGKSTLLNIVGCLDVPTSGKYIIDGDDVSKVNDGKLSQIRGEKVGFIFQSYNLLPDISVLENVALSLFYIRQKQSKERAQASLDRMGIGDKANNKPLELSGGQQQRAGIARAIIKSPKILLSDEPTGNLDTQSSTAVMGILQKLNAEQKIALLTVTHEDEIAKHHNRIVRMTDGKIVSEEIVSDRIDSTQYSQVGG